MPHGTHALPRASPARRRPRAPSAGIFLKQIRISGISMGNQKAQERMVSFLDTTSIRPVISDTFPLSRLADAFQHQVDHKHFGKIGIQIGGPTSRL